MPELNKYDLHWCVRRLPRTLRDVLKREAIVVAGGYIRACILNEQINDVDLFVDSKQYAKDLALDMAGGDEKRLVETVNAITIKGMKYPVQFITRWTYGSPHDVLQSFDYTICQSAFWWDHYCQKWCSSISESFYSDLAAKRLVYTEPIREEEPGGSILRVLKYYQRGYRITIDSFSRVITRLAHGVDLNRINTDANGHVDTFEFQKVVRGLLHEVDPNIDPDHIIEDVRFGGDDD